MNRKTLVTYGLKMFAVFFALMETDAYLNRNPAASTADLIRGSVFGAAICAALAFVAAFALKQVGDDVDT
jgi:hypothetical protein